jgi:hypothetical protein
VCYIKKGLQFNLQAFFYSLFALTLNLLKGFLERSKKPFNRFRVSAGNIKIRQV